MSKLTVELMARRNNKPSEFELKGKPIVPCPFCGERKEIHVCEHNDFPYVWLSCTLCGCEGPARGNRFHAIQAWQKRLSQQPTGE